MAQQIIGMVGVDHLKKKILKEDILAEEYKWPITLKDIDPFKEKACIYLKVPTSFKDLYLENSKIEKIEFHFSPPVRFRDKYLKI